MNLITRVPLQQAILSNQQGKSPGLDIRPGTYKVILEIDVVQKGDGDGSAPSGCVDKLVVAKIDAYMKARFLFGVAEKDKVSREKSGLGYRRAVGKLGRGSPGNRDAGQVMGIGDQTTAVKSLVR